MILSEYHFDLQTMDSSMRDVIEFPTLDWFAENISDTILLKQQLLFSLYWYLTVSSCGWKVGCIDFLVNQIVTENIVAYVSDFTLTYVCKSLL